LHIVDAGRGPEDYQRRRLLERFSEAARHEALRQVLWREMRVQGGQRAIAEVVRVGRAVVRKFLEMRSIPHRSNLDRIQEWAADRPEVVPALESVCLVLLVDDLPPAARRPARQKLARLLSQLHAERGAPIPAWLARESDPARVLPKDPRRP
jgi:hypothetical protein